MAHDVDDRLPVSLVTGFLGSGKTTLLNRLLAHPDMAGTALVINELGDVPIDDLLVEKRDDDVLVMANGCLCCSVRDDIEGVIGTLFGRRGDGTVPAFDRMLIETSGLADPAPIMQMLIGQPLVNGNFRLDSVVTVVDAIHGERHLAEHPEALKQVALADRLVVSKTDLADAASIEAFEAELRRRNPQASVLRAVRGDVEPSALFGAGRLDSGEAVERWLGHVPFSGHRHARDVTACSLEHPRALRWKELNAWLSRIRVQHGERLLRLKGVVELEGEPLPVALHGVHHVFHPPRPLAHLKDAGLKGARVVVIAPRADAEAIASSWNRFIEEPFVVRSG